MDFANKHFGPAIATVVTIAAQGNDETPTNNHVDLTGYLGPMESFTEPPRQSDPGGSRKRRAERLKRREREQE